jgi:hypothetical protein
MLATFVYIAPTKEVSGPNITPRSKETVTTGTSTLITLFRKSTIFGKKSIKNKRS